MSTVCLSGGGGGGGATNECHREVHYGTLACCWFQNGGSGGSGWAARCSEMEQRCCWIRKMRYLEEINEQKMWKKEMEDKNTVCTMRSGSATSAEMLPMLVILHISVFMLVQG